MLSAMGQKILIPRIRILSAISALLTLQCLHLLLQNYTQVQHHCDQNKSVLLLWWSTFPDWGIQEQRLAKKCLAMTGINCVLSSDRKDFPKSDALIFNRNDVSKTDMPPSTKLRSRGTQKWVFMTLESPALPQPKVDPPPNFTFNWIMSYRLDSDIYFPYGSFVRRNTPSVEEEYRNGLQNLKQRGLIAWMVTHCNATSMRDNIVREMKRFVSIDVYGECASLKCNLTQPECYEILAQDYKFYLAFENAVCLDYITEKAWNPLLFGMVPIVYGGGDYGSALPPHSFIDVTQFQTVQELTSYILYLDQNDDEYLGYFDWRRDYEALERNSYCRLCQRILEEKESGGHPSDRVYPDVWSVFTHNAKAHRQAPHFLKPYLDQINQPQVPVCYLFDELISDVI